ncbi:MAG: FecR family protein [Bacteroidota bacterium]
MNYNEYKTEDFLSDEFFISWIIDADPAATHFWEKWLSTHPEKRVEVEQAKEFARSIHYKNSATLSDTEYSQIFENLLRSDSEKKPVSIRKKRLKTLVYGLAASIALILVFLLGNNQSTTQSSKPINTISVSTQYGQRKTIKLPDGTIVKLNIGSTIQYPESFDSDQRKVSLVGEAYFDVVQNKKKPFIIESNKLTTEVIGTSFNLSAYPEDKVIEVSVVTGMVKIRNEEGEIEVLSPSDMGIYSRESNSISKQKYDPDILAWNNGTLIFKNDPLPETFKKLERWYGVEFEFSKEVKLEGTYSGRYQNKSLELILEGISYTSHIKYIINNKKITIYE